MCISWRGGMLVEQIMLSDAMRMCSCTFFLGRGVPCMIHPLRTTCPLTIHPLGETSYGWFAPHRPIYISTKYSFTYPIPNNVNTTTIYILTSTTKYTVHESKKMVKTNVFKMPLESRGTIWPTWRNSNKLIDQIGTLDTGIIDPWKISSMGHIVQGICRPVRSFDSLCLNLLKAPDYTFLKEHIAELV